MQINFCTIFNFCISARVKILSITVESPAVAMTYRGQESVLCYKPHVLLAC